MVSPLRAFELTIGNRYEHDYEIGKLNLTITLESKS